MQNEIQQGRYNGILHKLFDMKEGAPSPTLATDVFPGITLENDRPEWHFLGGEAYGVAGQSLAAVAASYASIVIWNPIGSGIITIVERLTYWGGAAGIGDIRQYTGTPAGYTNINRHPRDSRAGWTTVGQGTPTTRVAYAVSAGVDGNVVGRLPIGVAYVPYELTEPWVLSPGFALLLIGPLNTAFGANLWWRERALSPSESR